MIFEICAILAVFLFAILVIYIVNTLIAIQKTLKQHSSLTLHFTDLTLQIEDKLKKMDSTFQSISNLGDISEEETLRIRNHLQHLKSSTTQLNSERTNYTDDLAMLLSATFKLVSKFLRRK